MTGSELLNLALNHNLNVTTLSHLKLLSDKYDVPFLEVQQAGKSLKVCVIKKTFETFIGRVGFDAKLEAFATHCATAREAELVKADALETDPEPFNDSIPI